MQYVLPTYLMVSPENLNLRAELLAVRILVAHLSIHLYSSQSFKVHLSLSQNFLVAARFSSLSYAFPSTSTFRILTTCYNICSNNSSQKRKGRQVSIAKWSYSVVVLRHPFCKRKNKMYNFFNFKKVHIQHTFCNGNKSNHKHIFPFSLNSGTKT